MKLIIAGGRDFNDYRLLEKSVNEYRYKNTDNLDTDIQIISGGANGADRLGERYAEENNLALKIFSADWNKWGKSAGPRRNTEMAEYADTLMAFYDGKSKGTSNMILTAKIKNLKVHIIKY